MSLYRFASAKGVRIMELESKGDFDDFFARHPNSIVSIGLEGFYPSDKVLWLAPVRTEVLEGDIFDRLDRAYKMASSIGPLVARVAGAIENGTLL
jgi:hypothetical protein